MSALLKQAEEDMYRAALKLAMANGYRSDVQPIADAMRAAAEKVIAQGNAERARQMEMLA